MRKYTHPPQIDETAFGFVMDQGLARIVVAWLSDNGQKVHVRNAAPRFDLETPDGFIRCRRYIKNIVDWGRGHRLREIQGAFDFVYAQQERQKMGASHDVERDPFGCQSSPLTESDLDDQQTGSDACSTSSGSLEFDAEVRSYLGRWEKMNNITYLYGLDYAPERISLLCDQLVDTNRPSFNRSLFKDQIVGTPDEYGIQMLRDLHRNMAREVDVKAGVIRYLFPGINDISRHGLKVKYENSFKRERVLDPVPALSKIARPRPAITYGYSTDIPDSALSKARRWSRKRLSPRGGAIGECLDLAFPFLTVEVCGYGIPEVGDTTEYLAEYQCKGASVSCINIVSKLNDLMRQYPNGPVVSDASFSVVMGQLGTDIFVSWRNDDGTGYHIAPIAGYYLKAREDYIHFRRCIRNIINWGKGERLAQIQEALGLIIEQDENKKMRFSGNPGIERVRALVDGTTAQGSRRGIHKPMKS
ncbi:hypothetical protein PG999_008556 [Apiospora kogelbergensis]|uniref:DUF7924 domain-containing protein n=1 Tax=Apiospora kogelbergensis TaxID=1337665 RepID=A0AAW0QGN8_9PEZI